MKDRPPILLQDLARIAAWLISKPLWFLRFEGVENIPPAQSGPLVIAANHQTYIDPVWICIPMRRPFRFMAFDKAFEWPIVGSLIRQLGAFPVKHPIDNSPRVFKETLRSLKDGYSIVVFPEGAREFADGAFFDFKTGAAVIAQRAGVPILPVTISGANRVWPQGRKWPSLFRRVTIIYHSPLHLNDSKSAEEWTALLRAIIRLDES